MGGGLRGAAPFTPHIQVDVDHVNCCCFASGAAMPSPPWPFGWPTSTAKYYSVCMSCFMGMRGWLSTRQPCRCGDGAADAETDDMRTPWLHSITQHNVRSSVLSLWRRDADLVHPGEIGDWLTPLFLCRCLKMISQEIVEVELTIWQSV